MKTKKAKRKKPESQPCFECENGTLHEEIQDYSDEHSKLGKFTVANVPVKRCDQCDELLLTSAGGEMIDAYLDKALNVISPDEIQAFLSKYQLTQKAASKVTGLGEKNISRWLGGKSRPSESVSNFLRLILADESAFKRLKQKNFSESPVQV